MNSVAIEAGDPLIISFLLPQGTASRKQKHQPGFIVYIQELFIYKQLEYSSIPQQSSKFLPQTSFLDYLVVYIFSFQKKKKTVRIKQKGNTFVSKTHTFVTLSYLFRTGWLPMFRNLLHLHTGLQHFILSLTYTLNSEESLIYFNVILNTAVLSI